MILLSTGSLCYYGLRRIFTIARDSGYDGVELIIDDRIDTIHTSYLSRLSEETGMPIRSIHAPFFFVDPPGWPKGSIGKAEKSLAIAEELGAGVLVLHMPCLTEREYIDWIGDGVAELQSRSNVIIGVENMPCVMKPLGRLGTLLGIDAFYTVKKSRFLYRLLSLMSARVFPLNRWEDLMTFDHVVLDTTHMATGGYDIFQVYRLLGDKLVHLHLSNFDGREHTALDKGVLPMAGFVRELGADGFRGCITLEFIPDLIGATDERTAREVLSENLRFVRENLAAGRRGGSGSAKERPQPAVTCRA